MLVVACGGRTNNVGARSDTTASPTDASVDTAGAQVVIDAGTDAGPPPSCAPGGPGMTNCGPGGSGTESCCTSLEVEGGTYYRTYDPIVGYAALITGGPTIETAPDGGPTSEADPASVSGFRLDKYLVTVGRFRQFVSAWNGGAGWVPPAGSGKHAHLNERLGLLNVGTDAGGEYETGWLASDDSNIALTVANLTCATMPGDGQVATWLVAPGPDETMPIDCVTWYEAYAFCIWDGGFLPSEAEWEYAAAGGSQQREYAWGSANPGTANQYAIYDCNYTASATFPNPLCQPAPVGTPALGVGRWGQLDLGGNVSEWTLDWYADSYVDPCADCAYLPSAALPSTLGSGRVIRGGGYGFDWDHMPAAARDLLPPTFRAYFGFRCARTP